MLKMLERVQRKRAKWGRLVGGGVSYAGWSGSVADSYAETYPRYLPVPHLARVVDLFERALAGERVRACVSLPPRAGKTELLIGGMLHRLRVRPGSRVGYASHGARLAEKKSARVREFARRFGLPIDPASHSKRDWRTGIGEGGLWATSVGGQIVGEGFELLVLDDLIAGREDAESTIIRDKTYDWIVADCITRMEPNGAIIVCGTRYHADDHIGRLVKEGWEEIVIPALDTDGESYWPERWSRGHLESIREIMGGDDGYNWCSLYMGKPRAPGDAVFNNAQYSAEVGLNPRFGVGVDFAYTVKKGSDHSAAVVLAEAGGTFWIVDVLRCKVPEAEFRRRVGEIQAKWGAELVVGYIAATEQPNIDLLQAAGIPAVGQRAVIDKKSRALGAAAGWNTGRIKVLPGQPWTKDFVSEVVGFTGADREDDQVDAMVAIYDAMHHVGDIDWDFVDRVHEAAPRALSWELN